MKLSLPAQTILLPSPVLIIGTYGADGRPNMMNAAWGGIASSAPPCISVSLREATLSHHNITQTEAFTVNIPSEKYLREADFVGMVVGTAMRQIQRDPPHAATERIGGCPHRQRVSLFS